MFDSSSLGERIVQAARLAAQMHLELAASSQSERVPGNYSADHQPPPYIDQDAVQQHEEAV